MYSLFRFIELGKKFSDKAIEAAQLESVPLTYFELGLKTYNLVQLGLTIIDVYNKEIIDKYGSNAEPPI